MKSLVRQGLCWCMQPVQKVEGAQLLCSACFSCRTQKAESSATIGKVNNHGSRGGSSRRHAHLTEVSILSLLIILSLLFHLLSRLCHPSRIHACTYAPRVAA